MSVILSNILNPHYIHLNVVRDGCRDALTEVVDIVKRGSELNDPMAFCDALMEREEVESTYMGHGIAFPHARTNAVDEMVVAVGRNDQGIQFENVPEKVKLMFVIGTPVKLVQEYLSIVGCLARLLKEENIRAKLFDAENAETFIDVIRRAECQENL
ncbi:MAG: PTS sugar transporter subunit IIA [Verrucomicrobiota bacterium]